MGDVQAEPIRLTWIWVSLLILLPVVVVAVLAAALVVLIPVLVIVALLMAPFRLFGRRGSGSGGGFERVVNIAGLFLPPRVRAERTIQMLPFRIEMSDAQVVQCLLRGYPRGGSIELGDELQLNGRWGQSRGGRAFKVRRAVNDSSGSAVHGALPPSVRINDVLKVAVPIVLLVVILIAVAANAGAS